MLISTRTHKLVLNLRNPARITTVIPTARRFEYKGHELVAVPHRLDEVRLLRNLGIQAPAPIRHYYDWPRYRPDVPSPFEAQLATAEFLTVNPRAFVLNDLGTGKTLAALWAYDYLRTEKKAHRMLVACTVSTMERTWADEIFRHLPHLQATVLYGSRERRLKLLEQDADIYIINHDGIQVIEKALIDRPDIDTVIVDEIASFRNSGTDRWKSLRRICQGRDWLWGMTATPTPNEPTDAWAQCRLISPDRVTPYFGKFRDATMKQFGQFRWLPRSTATEIVAEAMQPSVRFTRDQCVDMPPCIYIPRDAPLTPEQEKAYRDMKAKLLMEYQQQSVLAVNEAVKLQKLIQIACGVVYDQFSNPVVLPVKPRMDVVREVIDQAGTKTIVFVPFKSVLHHVVAELRKTYGADAVAEICGETPKRQRDDIFQSFQREALPRVLVAQPAAMSHGLTLTAANTILWYAPVTSNEIYTQANGRITRPSQKHTQYIVNVSGCDAERCLYKRLSTKGAMQGLLLEVLRG